MKEFIIALLIVFVIYKTVEITYDMINGIIQSKKWSKTKNEIVEYLKTLGKSEVIGYSNDADTWEAQIIMETYEIEKNIETLFGYSFAAKRLHKVFDWKKDGNVLVYKVSS